MAKGNVSSSANITFTYIREKVKEKTKFYFTPKVMLVSLNNMADINNINFPLFAPSWFSSFFSDNIMTRLTWLLCS